MAQQVLKSSGPLVMGPMHLFFTYSGLNNGFYTQSSRDLKDSFQNDLTQLRYAADFQAYVSDAAAK